MNIPRQCAVLVGGRGTRLGALTAETPKPLLDCGGKPFLAWIIRELSRFGIEEIVLLAGYKPDRIEAFVRDAPALLPKSVNLKVSTEPAPAGTGGALFHARELLDDVFILVNGDSWLDANLARFMAGASATKGIVGHVLLRDMADVSRYGAVELSGRHVTSFWERPAFPAPGLINSGLYVLQKGVLDFAQPNGSLERDVLPDLAKGGLLSGQVVDGYFVDIGVPADYAEARAELPKRLLRPAIFFDRDGVLNRDLGWVGTSKRFQWTDGAKDAVAGANDAGFHAFVVTNQAGVARGHYAESDIAALHRAMESELLMHGASIDDFRYCPHHPDASLPQYRVVCECRKPRPGMLRDLISKWNVDLSRSFLIGNSESDLAAAERAGLPGFLYSTGNLADFTKDALAQVRECRDPILSNGTERKNGQDCG